MADDPEGTGGEQGQGLRARRHQAKQTQTYSLFLKDLCERSGLPRERAEKALVSVLCVLEQRLLHGEVDDLRAHLPTKLQEALQACTPRPEQPPGKVGLDEFLQKVAEDLGGDQALALSVTRAVLGTVRAHISEGEAEQVGHELPADLRALWARPI
jgi:uncharacterized protein (DUF2267 family)